ncbi:MAG: lmo0937 family membrane protein [Bacteroidota bacterium]
MYSISNILYYLAILFGGIWAVGFFIYNSGNIIHVFLALSIIALILRIIRGRDSST